MKLVEGTACEGDTDDTHTRLDLKLTLTASKRSVHHEQVVCLHQYLHAELQ